MFRKNLKRELKQYLRRLWPYAIAVVVSSILSYILIVNDHNPYEAWGLLMGTFLFVEATLAFVVRGLIHAFITFNKSVSAEKVKSELPLTNLLLAPILAFMIFIIMAALLILAGVSIFAWEDVGQMFSAFGTEWPYFLEFLFYLIITALTVYIIPTTWITVFRFNKQKKWPRALSMIIGCVTFFLCFSLIIVEILLLIHSPSTDMQSAWATTITLLSVFTLVDIGMLLLTCHTLKTSITR